MPATALPVTDEADVKMSSAKLNDSNEGIENVFDPIRFLLLNLGLCKCCRFHLKNVDSIRFLQELHFSNEICNSF